MRSARKNSDNFEENLLKLVRTLPTVLKFLPSLRRPRTPATLCR